MGRFERFTTKTHFNTLKRLVMLVGLAVLAVKLAVAVLWAAPAGSPLDLLARLAASVADLGAVLLVFEVLRSRRPANRAARSAVLLAVSPALLVASGIHGDPAGVAVALLLLGMYLLVDQQAPLAAGIAELLDDPERRREMGQGGRERVRKELAWEHSAPVLLAAYDRLWPVAAELSEHRSPAS
jgi:hypothetical protein